MRFPGRWRHGPVSVYSAMLGLRHMLRVSLRNSSCTWVRILRSMHLLSLVFSTLLILFSRPLVSGSHWFGVRRRSTGSYSALLMYCQSTKAWFFTYFYVGLLGSFGRFSSALVVSIGSCMCKAGFSDDFAPRAICLLSCCLAQMLGIIADMDQTDSYVATRCSSSRSSTFPSRHRGGSPRSCRTTEIHQWRVDTVVDFPVVQVQQILRSCLCEASRDPTVQLVVFVFGQGRRRPCRGAGAVSHGPRISSYSTLTR